MKLTNLTLFSMARQHMGWLTQRQAVLSQNIANADTPGYEARDLKPLEFRPAGRRAGVAAGEARAPGGAGRRLQPALTHAGHASGAERRGGWLAGADRRPREIDMTGNTVSVEDQLMKVSETSTLFQQTTNLYQKQLDMLKLALTRRS